MNKRPPACQKFVRGEGADDAKQGPRTCILDFDHTDACKAQCPSRMPKPTPTSAEAGKSEWLGYRLCTFPESHEGAHFNKALFSGESDAYWTDEDAKEAPCPAVHPNGQRCSLKPGHEGSHALT